MRAALQATGRAATPRGPDRARREVAAAIGADVLNAARRRSRRKMCAFEGTDTRLHRVGREVFVAIFAIRPKFERHVFSPPKARIGPGARQTQWVAGRSRKASTFASQACLNLAGHCKIAVDPFGEFHAVAERGGLMGNRGGRIHRDDRTLSGRRWTSRRWIVCVCAFKGRKREVWGNSYTELFFSMSRPRWLRATAPARESAGARRRSRFSPPFPAPRGGDSRWTKYCIASASRAAANASGARVSATCPTER